jgi:hypothetical protein
MNAYRKYKALMFTLGRRYADRWQAQISYVYSKSEGTVNNTSEGLFNRSSFYETPTLALTNSDGRLTNDRPHEVKAFIGYEIPKLDISVNAMFRSISGPTYTPFQRFSSTALNYSTTGYYYGFSAGRSRTWSRAAAAGCRRRRCSTCGSRRCSTSRAATGLPCSPTSEHHEREHGDGAARARAVHDAAVAAPGRDRDDRGDLLRGAELDPRAAQINLGARWSF